ncbi:copper-binding protein [Brevundimonas staleyi]|uniref:Copper-binding protein n=1 Tax=Brevundimonas staleyi TaxID=74326 RepID=A0ABW0FQU2_9CAUL|nr:MULTISPECIES: copper-binding protein [Brevundimonas]MDM8354065.1 copper-binding protein [Brevundimonas diminuta]MRL67344.1 copper-binding protein [Brevundimonas sp. SPF441]
MKNLFENSRTLALRLSLSAGAVILLAACSQQPAADTETPVDANSAAAPAAAEMDGMSTATAEEKSATARGVISAIDAQGGKITIEHEPIASLGWPAMTMGFAASPALIDQAKVGDRVEFDLVVVGSAGELKALRPQ